MLSGSSHGQEHVNTPISNGNLDSWMHRWLEQCLWWIYYCVVNVFIEHIRIHNPHDQFLKTVSYLNIVGEQVYLWQQCFQWDTAFTNNIMQHVMRVKLSGSVSRSILVSFMFMSWPPNSHESNRTFLNLPGISNSCCHVITSLWRELQDIVSN